MGRAVGRFIALPAPGPIVLPIIAAVLSTLVLAFVLVSAVFVASPLSEWHGVDTMPPRIPVLPARSGL
jgi:hypothetical protein